MKTFLKAGLAVAALVAATAGAQQIMIDPTRPPTGVLNGEGVANYGGPMLQSVIVTPAGRVAIISGERVKQGDTYGGARVVSITETEVVLRSDSGTETLRLYPSVNIRKAAAGGGKRSQDSRGTQHE